MAQAAKFCSFQAKIVSWRYHVYKNPTWVDAREGDGVQVDIETNKESINVDPYACAIPVKEMFFGAMKTVVGISRERFLDMFTFSLKHKLARPMEKFYLSSIDPRWYHPEA